MATTSAIGIRASSTTIVSQGSRTRHVVPFSATPVTIHRGALLHSSSRSLAPSLLPSRVNSTITHATDNDPPVKYNKEFGYSRKDIIIITFGLIALGYAMYYGLQATGMEAGMAGNWVQLIIFLGICVGWISTYLFRVATKQMTYVKQLEAYEEAVIRKRIEEMTEAEMEELMREAEGDKGRKGGNKQ